MNQRKLGIQIFLTTFYLSAFTFGGGYVIVTLMKKKFVDEKHWIDENEMLDLIAIAQSSPGAIAVNGAIVVGYKLAGLSGILFAILGTILPPFIIISGISLVYEYFIQNLYIAHLLEGMQAGVGAVIVSVVYEMGKGLVKEKDYVKYVIFLMVFILNFYFNINIMILILLTMGVGLIQALRKRGFKK